MRSFARSSPRQTFVVAPAIVLATQAARRRVRIRPRWLLLCALGYFAYRAAGAYRREQHAGPEGFAQPPDRLVTTGPYALSRNPMYLGHLRFLAGLGRATGSPFAAGALVWQAFRLSDRVAIDEERLERIFGDEYREYRRRVPRWL